MKKKIVLLAFSHILVAVLTCSVTLFLIPRQIPVLENPTEATEASSEPTAPETRPRNPYATNPCKLEELEYLIQYHYYEDVDSTAQQEGAASGMIDALGDRWSYYIPADEYDALVRDWNNAYVGIGIATRQWKEDSKIEEIMKVFERGPAEEAGLQAGDKLVAFDGQPATGMSSEEASTYMYGPENSQVDVTVLRDGEELTLTVTRRYVQVPVAKGVLLENGIGLVVIEDFQSRSRREAVKAIEALLEQGAEKLIFDVRYNPGGTIEEMVKLLDYLLPEGPIYRSIDNMGQESVRQSDAQCLDIPMAVLVNENTYSAAEFFAAALSEYDAAVVVGTQTCGKGRYQQRFQMKDGSAVSLSTGQFFTPNGISLEGVGITPDVVVPVDETTAEAIYFDTLAPEEDPQLQAAVAALG